MTIATGIDKINENSEYSKSSEKERANGVGGLYAGQLPAINEKIYDLLDVVAESPHKIFELSDIVEEPNPHAEVVPYEITLSDPGAHESLFKMDELSQEPAGIRSEEKPEEHPQSISEDVIEKIIVKTVERIARAMIPGIAERIIREEIEQLKKELEEEVP